MDYKFDLLNLVDNKDYEEAYDAFNDKIKEFIEIILNNESCEHDSKLPGFLRVFTSGSIYCKIMSLYATEVLQKLGKYEEANEIFDFLLFKQKVYSGGSRAKYYERYSINLEAHMKEPIKAFEILKKGIKETKFAGRLGLYQRLVKMSETKRYSKIKQLDDLKKVCEEEKYEFIEAPTVEIVGTILHSEFVPGRKNIFIQNYEHGSQASKESQDDPSPKGDEKRPLVNKKRYNLSVEEVALTHYTENLGFTNGKHSETSVLTTIFGILLWDIIFDNNVYNVFVDKFQSAPLDLQTDFFIQIEKRLLIIN